MNFIRFPHLKWLSGYLQSRAAIPSQFQSPSVTSERFPAPVVEVIADSSPSQPGSNPPASPKDPAYGAVQKILPLCPIASCLVVETASQLGSLHAPQRPFKCPNQQPQCGRRPEANYGPLLDGSHPLRENPGPYKGNLSLSRSFCPQVPPWFASSRPTVEQTQCAPWGPPLTASPLERSFQHKVVRADAQTARQMCEYSREVSAQLSSPQQEKTTMLGSMCPDSR